MLKESLTDLDKLVSACRYDKTKEFFTEAVACYKSGAFRAAIVTTWITVVFDYIAKIRELELAGDGQARKELERFEQIHLEKDTKKAIQLAQDFERDVLDFAKDRFELLSSLEYKDLQRLYEDRHRCAHPSMQTLEEPYQPSSELVYLHIRNASIYFLQQPPVQGKAALDRIWADIHSSYFPTDVDQAKDRLIHGPLIRARTSVIRNIVLGLTKDLLKEERSQSERERQFAALLAVLQIHDNLTSQILCSELPKIVATLSDDKWPYLINYIHIIPLAWEAIGIQARETAVRVIQNCPLEDADMILLGALQIPFLKESVVVRLPDLPFEVLVRHLQLDQSPEYLNEAISRFSSVENFDAARAVISRLISPFIPLFTIEQVILLIQAFGRNRQLYRSFKAANLVTNIFIKYENHREETKDVWVQLFTQFHMFTGVKIVKIPELLSQVNLLLDKIIERYPEAHALATKMLQEQYLREVEEWNQEEHPVSEFLAFEVEEEE